METFQKGIKTNLEVLLTVKFGAISARKLTTVTSYNPQNKNKYPGVHADIANRLDKQVTFPYRRMP